ncbi:MAG: type II toxin-antitoxin system death-on-curing family toxin [archaeon]|nr:type II toxin-antitoxin system death-on-curing family toxin [archaeon]
MTRIPTPEKIIEFNLLVLELIKVKKADQTKVLSRAKIKQVLEDCSNVKGDIYDKAMVLLKGLVQKHPFASGNRRTAFIATRYFVETNKAKLKVENKEENAKILLGIRENYYSDDEIKEWIKNGKIREFKR